MSGEQLIGIPPDLIIGPSADVLPLAGEVNWGMERLGVSYLRSITDGSGQITGIVDTGVDREHPLLANCIAAKDFTGSPYGATDRQGHGSHCTGTVGATDPRIGVATGAKMVHGKGLGDSGSGSDSMIANAMRWCAAQGAEVVSMSLGSSGPSPGIDQAGRELTAAGIWVVCAAGNSGGGTSEIDYPGRYSWAISVAALGPNLAPATFTSAGDKIDTSGPGVDIWSVRPGGGYRSMSGTSMATPFVAGLLTLFRAALKARGLPIPSTAELRSFLFSRSTDTHTPGDDRRTGPGWCTPLLLQMALTADPPRVT